MIKCVIVSYHSTFFSKLIHTNKIMLYWKIAVFYYYWINDREVSVKMLSTYFSFHGKWGKENVRRTEDNIRCPLAKWKTRFVAEIYAVSVEDRHINYCRCYRYHKTSTVTTHAWRSFKIPTVNIIALWLAFRAIKCKCNFCVCHFKMMAIIQIFFNIAFVVVDWSNVSLSSLFSENQHDICWIKMAYLKWRCWASRNALRPNGNWFTQNETKEQRRKKKYGVI